MSVPNPKGTTPAAAAKSTIPTLEEAIKQLSKNPKMVNPFGVPDPASLVDGVEPFATAKIRLRTATSFEVARKKQEDSIKKATGITGGYGRVPSITDRLRAMAAANQDGPFSLDSFAAAAESLYQANNPERKKSPDGSKIYSQALLDAFRLVGLVSLNPETKSYSITPAFKAILLKK